MESEKFAYIWQFTVDDQHKVEFLAAYDATGTWAQLFLKDDTDLGTELLVDESDPSRYVTIDYWTSKAARDDFRKRFRTEFEELDRKCEEFTSVETLIGDFVIVSSPGA